MESALHPHLAKRLVRIDATTSVDYLEEVKWNGRRVIVNVVWVNRPGAH